MTSTEQAGHRPTAKQLAEEALEKASEAATTAQQTLVELREFKETGTPASGTVDLSGVTKRLDVLDRDIEGLLDNLNQISAQVTAPIGPDGKPIDLSQLVVDIQKTFAAHAQKIDENNEAVRKTLDGIQLHGDPAANGSLQALRNEVDELAGWVKAFDEAGVAPASAEDVSSLDSRLRAVENRTHADAVMRQVSAPDGVPAVYRQMHQLMMRVSEIGKDSQASEDMGGYKFRSIDAAMSAVGHALREVGMMFVPREIVDQKVERYEIVKHYRNGGSSVQNWTHVWVRQRYAFVSLIDGSAIENIEMDGEARDNGDKSTSKADSMRYKYALLQALCIPTQGLPESDGRDGSEDAPADSWENAIPAEHYRQDARRQQQAGEPEGAPVDEQPQYQPGDAQHARSGADQAQPMAPQQPVDDRTDDEKAAAAVKALRDLMSLPPGDRRARFARIAKSVQEQHLGQMMVDGITVTRHLSAANGALVGSG